MIKVSVIVPVYNVEAYLDRCLGSLVRQTLKELEIIVVNDGTKDNSETIILRYAQRYPQRVRYFAKENGGLSDARNYGMQFVRGEYVAFLDGDDYIDEQAYESLYAASENGAKKIVECNFLREYPNRQKPDIQTAYRSVNDYMVSGRVVAWNKIYQWAWLKPLRIEFPKGVLYEDVSFFFKILAHLGGIEDVAVVRIPLIHYVQRSGAISYSETGRVGEIVTAYEDAFSYYRKLGLFDRYTNELEYKFCRNVFLAFSLKAIRIKDRKTRGDILDLFWAKVYEHFPRWKKNPYLAWPVSWKTLYLKCMNRAVYRLLYYI